LNQRWYKREHEAMRPDDYTIALLHTYIYIY
jgi:hypothetical protein